MPRHDWRSLTQQGIDLVQRGNAEKALPLLQKAYRKAPGQRVVRYWLGNALRMTGRSEMAQRVFRQMLSQRPDDFDASFALAFLFRDNGKPEKAADTLAEAAAQPGVSLNQLLQVAGFMRDINQFEKAIPVCEKALALKPGQPDLHFKLARLYQATGRFDEALDSLRKTLDLAPATGPAWLILSQQKRFENADDEDFKRIRAAAGQSFGREPETCIAFAYGKALDDLGDWPRAWTQYEKGNRLKAMAKGWNPADWRRYVGHKLEEPPPKIPGQAGSERRAVFIVGMPRSGTTLLEQMLGGHPDISGRGETNFLAHFDQQIRAAGAPSGQQLKEMADMFWTQLRLEGSEGGFYVDKNPLNFRYLDTLFRLLPSARVLHVTRDARDICLSCYFQLFQHEDTAFSYDLDHLADFYAGYRQLMAHWEKVWSDRIRRVGYDDLVKKPAETMTSVLSFLGADWDEAVTKSGGQSGIIRTASVWQARQEVHTQSLGRWAHYHDEAPDFFDRLQAIDQSAPLNAVPDPASGHA